MSSQNSGIGYIGNRFCAKHDVGFVGNGCPFCNEGLDLDYHTLWNNASTEILKRVPMLYAKTVVNDLVRNIQDGEAVSGFLADCTGAELTLRRARVREFLAQLVSTYIKNVIIV